MQSKGEGLLRNAIVVILLKEDENNEWMKWEPVKESYNEMNI